MSYVELQTKEEIAKIISEHLNTQDAERIPPVFHGTDASLLEMNKEERDRINSACEIIINSVFEEIKQYATNQEFPLFLEDSITNSLLASSDSYGNSYEAYSFAMNRRNDCDLYQYGDFYVTNHPSRAIGYSREAWIYGETGWIANRLFEGAKNAGIKMPENPEFQGAFKIFEERKQMPKNPVVIVLVDGASSALFEENGRRMDGEIMGLFKKYYYMDMASYRFDITQDKELKKYLVRANYYDELINAFRR